MVGVVEEVVVKGGAVRFYCMCEADTGAGGVFLTQNEGVSLTHTQFHCVNGPSVESEGPPHDIANQALPLSQESYTHARARSVCGT